MTSSTFRTARERSVRRLGVRRHVPAEPAPAQDASLAPVTRQGIAFLAW